MKKFVALFVLLLCASGASAKVKLPTLVGDNMVLQRQSTVSLWGWAAPGDRIVVETAWNGETYRTQAQADSTWTVAVATTEAGGPYEIRIDDGEEVVLNNVMLGEVWVCSGQSNMEMPLKGFIGQPVAAANEAVAAAGQYPNLRLFTVDRARGKVALNDVKGDWQVSTAASALDFSAVGYYFGRQLNELLDVPVGLICTAWGGTAIEAWMTDESRTGLRTPPGGIMAGELYNGMIRPLLPYGIAGWIWYQGESNIVYPTDYAELMDRMVSLWRTAWGRGELPFYYVQIAPCLISEDPENVSTPIVRDEQTAAQKRIPNSGMAVTMDIGERTNIHPANKRAVGERLSYWALSETYGMKGIAFRAPEYRSMKINADSTVTVQFGYPEETVRGRLSFDNGLAPWDVEFDGFELAGEDRVFYPAKAKVDRTGRRNSVTVRSERVPRPVAVRYCWKNYAQGTLFSTMGLPVSSFRSDDWPVTTDYSR